MALETNVSRLLNEMNNSEDCWECELEHCYLGLKTVSTIVFIALSIVCGVSAIGGNVALLGALNRTATFRGGANYYFIVSLALADFFVVVTMTPLYICYALAYEPYWLIKLEGFLWIVTVTATTYSLSVVSLDRFISVVYPLIYPQVMTEKRCRVIIFLIWSVSVVFGFPRLVLDDFVKLEKLWIACSVATVAIPLVIMSLSYGKIFSVVQRANRSIAVHQNANFSNITLGNRKAVVTIGIIVSLFIVTFIPTAVVYFMLLFEDDICKEYQLNDIWLWVALVSFAHSSFNPWVYGLRFRELRKTLRDQFFLSGS